MVTKRSVAAISFHGKDPDEAFQFYFRQHWIRLLKPFLKMLAMTVILGTFLYLLFFRISIADPELHRFALLFMLGIFLFCQLKFLHRVYRYFLYVVVVTDRKIHRFKKTLIVTDEHQTIDIWMLQDINKRQCGFLQNVLNYGSITLEAQETILRLHFIPRVEEKCDMLQHLRERARAATMPQQPKSIWKSFSSKPIAAKQIIM